jgi:hypothetical protein
MKNSNLSPTFHPYRVKPRREPAGPHLNPPTQRVLAALVELCPRAAGDVRAAELARLTGIRQGSVVVILRTLAGHGLALRHPGAPESWAPTLSGRVRARFLSGPAGEDGPRWFADEPRLLDRLAAQLEAAAERADDA